MDIQAATYYFPNYHAECRNEVRHGKNWSEWELMKCARSRFEGHHQPKIPLWGYEDEAAPAVMAKKIDGAEQHGINAFIFDWYWYDGPYLERCLKDGFLGAANTEKLKFALMWANHDWRNMHPGGKNTSEYAVDFKWTTTKASIGCVWDYVIENFLTRPNYWYVDGLPYFSIYAMNRFILQMGGVNDCAEVLQLFRDKAKKAGLPGIHLNGIWFDLLDTHPAYSACSQNDWVYKLGLNSYTSYNNVCATDVWLKKTEGLWINPGQAADEYLKMAEKAQKSLPGPYYPVVTVNWDTTPRCIQSDTYEVGGYPWMKLMDGTPEDFGAAVRGTLENLLTRPENERIFFINAWNEWTEGSYLEPDTRHGMAFLEQLKKQKGTII